MASSLDMSLDDRIRGRSNRERGRGRLRARRGHGQGPAPIGGRMPAAARGGPLRVRAQPSSYTIAKSIRRTRPFPWQRDLFEDSMRATGLQGVEVGTKLHVWNLGIGVTNEDIRELFCEIGDLERYAVHYNKNGQPTGSAEVVYSRRSDAFAALKRYNNVLLDGRPMKIGIDGGNTGFPISARVNVSAVNGQRKRTVVMTPRGGRTGGPAVFNHSAGWGQYRDPRRSGGTGRGRGRRRGRARSWGWSHEKKRTDGESADQLDKELETYHADAMNIS